MTDSDKEQYLQLVIHKSFEHEKKVFKIVEAAGLSVLPHLICPVQVLASTLTLAGHGRVKVEARALMLEYMPGSNLRKWMENVSVDTEDSLTRFQRDVRSIASQTFDIIHKIMYCGLTTSDMRLDNVHVSHSGESQTPIVRMYDAGANLMVTSMHSCEGICQSQKLETKGSDRRHHEGCLFTMSDVMAFWFDLEYFRTDIEGNTFETLRELSIYHHLLGDQEVIPYKGLNLDSNLTDLFKWFENTTDTIYWQVIMLCFWRFDRPSDAISSVSKTTKIMRAVSYILNTTRISNAREPCIERENWVFVGLARVCQAFCEDNYLESIARLASSTFKFLKDLRQDGVPGVMAHLYYGWDSSIPYKIFKMSPPLMHHRWRSESNLLDRLDLDAACAFVPDIARIRNVVLLERHKHRVTRSMCEHNFGRRLVHDDQTPYEPCDPAPDWIFDDANR